MGYIDRTFRSPRGAGFVSSVAPTDRAYQPHPQRDENSPLRAPRTYSFTLPATRKYRTVSDAAMRYWPRAP